MTRSQTTDNLIKTIRYNCDVSDARDHGIYSMCTLVLKLRNLYKWENNIEPWHEPESADLLDWIDAKERYWQPLVNASYRSLSINGTEWLPQDVQKVNRVVKERGLFYGAGFGRSMKEIFFLAEVLEKRNIEGCPVVVLGREEAREMASPFAMVQDETIVIRKHALRFFIWDHIQELRSSCRSSYRHVLESYHLLKGETLDQEAFRAKLDLMVNDELDLFIYHEVGELLERAFSTETFRAIVSRFPGSVMEFVCRAIKDLLADTHTRGVLAYIIRERRSTSLGFYIGFLDGLREKLFPEMANAWQLFVRNGEWQVIEEARRCCRRKILNVAGEITGIAERMDDVPDNLLNAEFDKRVLAPLKLGQPNSQ